MVKPVPAVAAIRAVSTMILERSRVSGGVWKAGTARTIHRFSRRRRIDPFRFTSSRQTAGSEGSPMTVAKGF